MHRFTFRFFVRLNLMGLAVALAACGGSTNACPSGFVATEGVCLPEPDAGTRVDGATADGDMPDANVADGALADAALDGDLADASPGATTYYVDMDMDGFGDPSTPMDAEVAPDGYVEDATDCDDTAMHVHPGADEVCNGVDDNCDGVVDEGVKTTFYADTDRDTFGDSSSSVDACTAPDGYVEDATDCDDTARGVHPGATEVCDGVDDDCNGGVDDALAAPSCALSAGVCAGATKTCGGRAGWAACVGTASYGPIYEAGAETSCDARDNDCDGTVDEGTRTAFYADCDADGARDASVRRNACDASEARDYFVANGHPGCRAALPRSAPQDCDDTRASVRPGAPEVCNGRDDNCDGRVDEGVKTSFYADCDGDGHGDAAGTTVDACTATEAAASFGGGCISATTMNDDCADADADAHPGQTLYFTRPITGPRTTGPGHDFNCDGAQERLYRSTTNCPSGTRQGWIIIVPACGEVGTFTPVLPSLGGGLICQNRRTQRQPCR